MRAISLDVVGELLLELVRAQVFVSEPLEVRAGLDQTCQRGVELDRLREPAHRWHVPNSDVDGGALSFVTHDVGDVAMRLV